MAALLGGYDFIDSLSSFRRDPFRNDVTLIAEVRASTHEPLRRRGDHPQALDLGEMRVRGQHCRI